MLQIRLEKNGSIGEKGILHHESGKIKLSLKMETYALAKEEFQKVCLDWYEHWCDYYQDAKPTPIEFSEIFPQRICSFWFDSFFTISENRQVMKKWKQLWWFCFKTLEEKKTQEIQRLKENEQKWEQEKKEWLEESQTYRTEQAENEKKMVLLQAELQHLQREAREEKKYIRKNFRLARPSEPIKESQGLAAELHTELYPSVVPTEIELYNKRIEQLEIVRSLRKAQTAGKNKKVIRNADFEEWSRRLSFLHYQLGVVQDDVFADLLFLLGNIFPTVEQVNLLEQELEKASSLFGRKMIEEKQYYYLEGYAHMMAYLEKY